MPFPRERSQGALDLAWFGALGREWIRWGPEHCVSLESRFRSKDVGVKLSELLWPCSLRRQSCDQHEDTLPPWPASWVTPFSLFPSQNVLSRVVRECLLDSASGQGEAGQEPLLVPVHLAWIWDETCFHFNDFSGRNTDPLILLLLEATHIHQKNLIKLLTGQTGLGQEGIFGWSFIRPRIDEYHCK